MASTPTGAVNLTTDQLVKNLLQKIELNVPIARILPFMGVQGGKLRVERTNPFGAAAGGSVPDVAKLATILDDNGSISVTGPEFVNNADESKTYTVGELAFRYKLDYTVQDRYKYQSVDAVLAMAACERLMLALFYKLDKQNGGALAGDFDSLYDIAAASPGTVGTNQAVNMGGALTLAKLHETFYKCFAGGVGPNAVMCNVRAARAITAAYQAAGLLQETVEVEFPNPLTGGTCKQRVNAINGVPIYINDCIETAAGVSRIYFVVFGFCPEKNIHGVTCIVPQETLNTLFIRREAAEPSGASTTQMNVTYTFPVAIAAGTYSAVSVLYGVSV